MLSLNSPPRFVKTTAIANIWNGSISSPSLRDGARKQQTLLPPGSHIREDKRNTAAKNHLGPVIGQPPMIGIDRSR